MPNFFRSDQFVKSTLGPAVPGAQIFVCDQPANVPTGLTAAAPTPTPLSTIYSDPDGLVPITQPIITDGFGHADFYVAPGTYDVSVYLSGTLQKEYPDQSIGLGSQTGALTTGNTVAGSGITITTVSGTTTIAATGGSGVLSSTTTITAAQLKALTGTPITLIAAPGANKMILPIGFACQYVYNTVPFTDCNGAYSYGTFSTTVFDGLGSFSGNPMFTQSNNRVYVGAPALYAQNAQTVFNNLPIKFFNTSGSGDPTVGDGHLVITVTYVIINL